MTMTSQNQTNAGEFNYWQRKVKNVHGQVGVQQIIILMFSLNHTQQQKIFGENFFLLFNSLSFIRERCKEH